MSADGGRERFDLAGRLFGAGRFQESLQTLESLNRDFPGNKEVLHAAALCLEQLGKTEQALRVCDDLIARHGDHRAQAIRDRLATPPPLDMGGLDFQLDFDLDKPRTGVVPPRLPASARRSNDWVWIAGAMLGIPAISLAATYWNNSLLLGTILPAMQSGAGFPPGPMAIMVLLNYVNAVALGTLAGYAGLKAVGSLPNDDFAEDIADTLKVAALCNLLCMTVVGIFYVPFHLKKRYDMSFGQLAGCIVLYIVISGLLSFVLSVPLRLLQGGIAAGAA